MKYNNLSFPAVSFFRFNVQLLIVLIVYVVGLAEVVNAQADVEDTVKLKEIVVVKQVKRYQVGAKIATIDRDAILMMEDANLEQLLSRFVAIPLKANAGSLTTIRLRGTSPNHTSINVGGINLNSLTLGSSNLSNIPVYFFEDVALQYGSASVVNGSGSIGGSLNLSTAEKWVDGVKTDCRISLGSFGEQFYGVKVYVGNGKFESVSKAYYFYKRNNFTFLHPKTKDFDTGEYVQIKDTQRNAAINNMGFMQEFGYKFRPYEYFRIMLWLEDDWHQIQQNMATNLNNPDMKDELEDEHLRIWSFYRNSRKALKKFIGAGYVIDNSIHNNNVDQPIKTNRFIAEGNLEFPLFINGVMKTGLKSETVSPSVYAYEINDVLQYQTDIYASYMHTFYSKLKLSLNLRKGFVTDFTVPFTPAIGVSYVVLSKVTSGLNLTGNISKSYRVPTFNDRFWVPGGNPDLLPEDGINYELGAKYSYYGNNVKAKVLVNAFYMDVKEWLLWKNAGAYWTAENVQNVISKGVELQSDIKIEINEYKLLLGVNYTLNSAERVKSANVTAALNRQLEYVPFQTGVFYTQLNYHKVGFSLDVNGVSWQYTNEEPNNILDGYVLTNVSVNYTFRLKRNHKLKTMFFVNNIFNVNYYSSWSYAMPGINFKGSISYYFN